MKLAFYISKVEIVTLKKDSWAENWAFLVRQIWQQKYSFWKWYWMEECGATQNKSEKSCNGQEMGWLIQKCSILVLESAVFLADFTFLLIGDFNLQRLSAQGCWQDHQLCSYSSSSGFLIKPSWQGRWDSGIGEREGEVRRMRKVRAWCLPPPHSKGKANLWRERETGFSL